MTQKLRLGVLALALMGLPAIAADAHEHGNSTAKIRPVTTAIESASRAPAPRSRSAPDKPLPGTYVIDVAHSHAYFFVSHLGVSRFMGRFDDIRGAFVVGQQPGESVVHASIPVASINAKHKKLEDHLRSPDFFDVAQFPEMSFESTRVRWNSRGEGTLSGNLTIHGVTRPVDFALKVSGAGKGPRGDMRAGFEANLTIRRSDYGMSYGLPRIVGDTVEVALSVEGILQQQ